METRQAVTSLAALAQETRLRIFRLLAAHGPDGVTAGELAEALAIPPNTLSFHLHQLSRAGLVGSRRDGRFVNYTVEPGGIRDLLAFLTDDCCRGRPELCGLPAPSRAACDDARR
jgi:ArsR family transcriptional regulator, arsenate/arsenite/antimonite-responsive transcriptional repressor